MLLLPLAIVGRLIFTPISLFAKLRQIILLFVEMAWESYFAVGASQGPTSKQEIVFSSFFNLDKACKVETCLIGVEIISSDFIEEAMPKRRKFILSVPPEVKIISVEETSKKLTMRSLAFISLCFALCLARCQEEGFPGGEVSFSMSAWTYLWVNLCRNIVI